jgi:hypothetical protein
VAVVGEGAAVGVEVEEAVGEGEVVAAVAVEEAVYTWVQDRCRARSNRDSADSSTAISMTERSDSTG